MIRVLQDTWVMAARSLRHTVRSVDTIITVAAMPIAMLLMFVYVFGSTFNTSGMPYVNFVTPGFAIMCILSGIAYASLRVNMDLQRGIINRFRCMPVSPSSVLGGHAVSSVVSNLVSVALVMLVALLIGFRSSAGLVQWLIFGGMTLLFTLATTWLAIVFGLLSKTAEGAGAFSYILLLMNFVSSAFVPTAGMAPWLRAFADNQPMTPLVQTMRSLLIDNTAGSHIWVAVAWCVGTLVVSYLLAIRIYRRQTA